MGGSSQRALGWSNLRWRNIGWRAVLLALGVAVALAYPASARAWGNLGHQTVARLAQMQLTPAAQTQLAQLLALEPGSTLESISTWADDTRDAATASWHYINFPRGQCHYEAQRDCPEGACVVGAIERQSAVLVSRLPDAEKLVALKYLVHLVADMHQPLHAGHQDDRGGNRYQLQAFMVGSNLHALWDAGLLRQRGESLAQLSQRLLASGPHPTAAELAWSAGKVAEESCRVVASPGFYPPHLVGLDYMDRFAPLLDQRLAFAGARLAHLLNLLLSGP